MTFQLLLVYIFPPIPIISITFQLLLVINYTKMICIYIYSSMLVCMLVMWFGYKVSATLIIVDLGNVGRMNDV